MPESNGTILIADDEPTVLTSLADLLRQGGYDCYCAASADETVRILRDQKCDLLLAGIRMPGNDDLALLRSLPPDAPPVILITGYPSLDTALGALQTVVVGYLVKPVDIEHLLTLVRGTVQSRRLLGSMEAAQDRIAETARNIEALAQAVKATRPGSPVPLATYADLHLANIANSLRDLRSIVTVLPGERLRPACHLLDCPRLDVLTDALRETSRVLELTKSSFKSKDLAQMRKKIELILEPGAKA
jgi:DNA-binding response OmpR family regulator